MVVAVSVAVVLASTPADASRRDPLQSRQWHLAKHGGINAAGAWRVSTGGNVVVAVIDSGVDLVHPDLVRNLWRSQDVPGNGIDDDHNGYVDDVHGWDFVTNDPDPSDENGHGTHVAGVIGARGGNRIGGSGVARRVKLMALRVLDDDNRGGTADVAAAIFYAVANGARVINLSLNSDDSDPQVESALAFAAAADVLVVTSAGNQGRNLDREPSYPACSRLPNVVTVGATTYRGKVASFSNRGRCVDLTAPGVGILSTAMGGGYEERTGTSTAAPQVTGAAVLVLAAHPSLSMPRLVAAVTARRGSRTRAAASKPRLRKLDLAAAMRSSAR